MQRIVITGANGSGKSNIARRLSSARPDLMYASYDALRLRTGWAKHAPEVIHARLSEVVAQDAWILDGGPSLLGLALPRCDAVIWLDPPLPVRAWRLIGRPWKNRGRTRPELPLGNVDWPLQQYRFAWASLRKNAQFRATIEAELAGVPSHQLWHCQTSRDVDCAIAELGKKESA